MTRLTEYIQKRWNHPDQFNAATPQPQEELPFTPQEQATQPQPVVDSGNAIGSLADLLGPTPAEREAQERRMMQNRQKMMAWTGLFDGLRHLGNLYYATKGATPQTLNNPYQLVDKEYQQQRNLYNDMVNYRRQYNTSLYNLRRQLAEDKRKDKLADAQQSWYSTRDEMARMKAENDRQRAEIDRLQKEANIRNTEAKTETENFLRDKRGNVYDSQVQRNKAQAAKAGRTGGGSGRSSSTYGYRTVKHVDPATGDVITERVPTTAGANTNAGNKSRYDKYRKNNQGSSQSSSNKWDKYKRN